MTAKADETRHLKREANHAKSDLIRLLTRLEGIGATGAASQLNTIIGRLEAWQNK
jgi:uncharacterized protein YkuJ